MFVQRFERGDAVPMANAAFRTVFEPWVDRHEPEHNLRADAVVIQAGADIERVLQSC